MRLASLAGFRIRDSGFRVVSSREAGVVGRQFRDAFLVPCPSALPMIAVLQRVTHAAVEVEAEKHRAEIGRGLLVLVGVERGDTEAEIAWAAERCAV